MNWEPLIERPGPQTPYRPLLLKEVVPGASQVAGNPNDPTDADAFKAFPAGASAPGFLHDSLP